VRSKADISQLNLPHGTLSSHRCSSHLGSTLTSERITNLSFISKLTERAVSTQIVSHLNDNGMMPRLQSAYRRYCIYVYCFYVGGVVAYGSLSPSVTV